MSQSGSTRRASSPRGFPPGGGRIVARCIVVDATRQLAPGEIVWDRRGRIVRLARVRGPAPDLCVLPGLVNAHVHLQIRALRGAPRGFVPWVEAVLAARATETAARRRCTARAAIAHLVAGGATALGEVDSTGDSYDAMACSPATGRWYRELVGFHLDERAARRLVRECRRPGPGQFRAGLSPHAPYSVSAALFAAARGACRHLVVHCAETAEEQQFLRSGTGPFADLLARLGRLPAGFRAPGVGAVRRLSDLGLLGPATQLVHCQELERGDAARIAEAGASVVVCPGTIAWFGRQPPPVPKWLAAGIPVALGTDSRASNEGLSLRAELAAAASMWPELRPSQLLAMATSGGARALGMPGLGTLRRGGRADLLVVEEALAPDRIVEAFVQGLAAPAFVVAGGVRVGAPSLRR